MLFKATQSSIPLKEFNCLRSRFHGFSLRDRYIEKSVWYILVLTCDLELYDYSSILMPVWLVFYGHIFELYVYYKLKVIILT